MDVIVCRSPTIEEARSLVSRNGNTEVHVWNAVDRMTSELRRVLEEGCGQRHISTNQGNITPLPVHIGSGLELTILSTGKCSLHVQNSKISLHADKITLNDQDLCPRTSPSRNMLVSIKRTTKNTVSVMVEGQTIGLKCDVDTVSVSSDTTCHWIWSSAVRWMSYVNEAEIDDFYARQPQNWSIQNHGKRLNIVMYAFFQRYQQGQFSYDDYLDSFGLGGVETVTLELAAELTKRGHRVRICVVPFKGSSFTDQRGITYCGVDDITDWNQVDVFCPQNLPFDYYPTKIYELLDRQRAKVFTWFHHRLARNVFNGHEFLVRAGFDLRFIYPSKWASLPFFENDYTPHQEIIGGGINPDLFPTSFGDPTVKKGRWVFHAEVGRGLDVSLNVFERLKSKVATSFTIATNSVDGVADLSLPPGATFVGSLGKQKLIELLCLSDYFVYPLTNFKGEVYHDTFSQCVIEAMACGVIVLSWDVACLREVYGELAVLLTPPDYPDYDRNADTGINMNMRGEAATEAFCDAILRLEESPENKEAIRRRAFEWARKQTWDKRAEQFLHVAN